MTILAKVRTILQKLSVRRDMENKEISSVYE